MIENKKNKFTLQILKPYYLLRDPTCIFTWKKSYIVEAMKEMRFSF